MGYTDWLTTLASAPVSELTYLAATQPEGSDLGDAAWAALGSRLGACAAADAVKAEQVAQAAEFGDFCAHMWGALRTELEAT